MTPTPNEKTPQEMAEEWASDFENHFAEGDLVNLRVAVDSVKTAFLAGHSLANESAQKEIERLTFQLQYSEINLKSANSLIKILRSKQSQYESTMLATVKERESSNARAARFEKALKSCKAAMTYAYEDRCDQYYLNVQKQIDEALAYDSEKRT